MISSHLDLRTITEEGFRLLMVKIRMRKYINMTNMLTTLMMIKIMTIAEKIMMMLMVMVMMIMLNVWSLEI